MKPLWYIALRDWLCEKWGHSPKKYWSHNGLFHSQCRICGHIQSKQEAQ